MKAKSSPSGNPVIWNGKHFAHLPAFWKCDIMEEKGVVHYVVFQGENAYVTLNDSELRLAKYALLRFRNMLIAKELPTEDVNALLLKLYK